MNKEILTLDSTLDQMDLIDTYRTFHPKTEGYNFLLNAHRIFSGINHILGHKTSIIQFEKIVTISSIFSDLNYMKLEINYKNKTRKDGNIWRLNSMLLKTNGLMKKSKSKSEKILR